MKAICSDLRAEQEELDALVDTLNEDQWHLATPFYDFTVKDQIEHLAYFDDRAIQAVADADGFKRHLEEEIKKDFSGMENHYRQTVGARSFKELMAWWRTERQAMVAELEKHGPKDRLPWYGPPMSALSFATARLMETWAHGQDIFDAFKVKRTPTDRLRHIAHLGVSTFGWSYIIHGLEIPQAQVRVELVAPSGGLWTWGTEDAPHRITGPAVDFCLIVVQRRHVDDTELKTEGDIARDWMLKAQCFAGLPEEGPAPGERNV
jgi:uncharacterized protein (TIGR03084 family)